MDDNEAPDGPERFANAKPYNEDPFKAAAPKKAPTSNEPTASASAAPRQRGSVVIELPPLSRDDALGHLHALVVHQATLLAETSRRAADDAAERAERADRQVEAMLARADQASAVAQRQAAMTLQALMDSGKQSLALVQDALGLSAQQDKAQRDRMAALSAISDNIIGQSLATNLKLVTETEVLATKLLKPAPPRVSVPEVVGDVTKTLITSAESVASVALAGSPELRQLVSGLIKQAKGQLGVKGAAPQASAEPSEKLQPTSTATATAQADAPTANATATTATAPDPMNLPLGCINQEILVAYCIQKYGSPDIAKLTAADLVQVAKLSSSPEAAPAVPVAS